MICVYVSICVCYICVPCAVSLGRWGGTGKSRGKGAIIRIYCKKIFKNKKEVQTTGHLPGESTGVRPAREVSASGSAVATLAPGLCEGQAARVRVWNTEASSFWDRREPESF